MSSGGQTSTGHRAAPETHARLIWLVPSGGAAKSHLGQVPRVHPSIFVAFRYLPARKYQRTREEIDLMVPHDHQHFHASRCVTQDENGGREARSDQSNTIVFKRHCAKFHHESVAVSRAVLPVRITGVLLGRFRPKPDASPVKAALYIEK